MLTFYSSSYHLSNYTASQKLTANIDALRRGKVEDVRNVGAESVRFEATSESPALNARPGTRGTALKIGKEVESVSL